jgi:hypothetical protein
MSADLVLQKALRARLVATSAVTNLVPATSVLDINQRPAPSPSIIIGEGQAVEGERIDRQDQRLFMDIHCWKREGGLIGVKAIAGAIRSALHSAHLTLDSGFQCADCRVSSMRFLRDPDGETSHAVVTVEALVCEVSS